MSEDTQELNSIQDPNENDKIVNVNIEEQMKTAYIDYSMSVIVGRALPDVRDGLKPVHRRVLFAMHELGVNFNKAHKKSARIVGEVLGKYHPHGDTAVYDTMVRMAQPWSMRYLMVDGQGNFGSQDGDGPAAMRYTEVRMHRYAESMMEDLDKETVDFSLNFDDTLQEPTVLPTRIPQLLVNGSSGIAVGMATNMMPHNLSEVIDGCIAYIDNNEISIDELMKFIKAPDFPTGGTIFGIEGIKAGAHTGRGRVVLRGKVNIETLKSGREQIVIYEVPYQVSRDALTEKIGYLVNNKIIEGITNVANESNKDGTRIVVDVRKDAVAQVIVNQLYKYSELQTSYGINNVAIVKGRPKTLNLKDLIAEFVNFRHEIIVRRTEYELREAQKRAHILEGYMKVIGTKDDLDRAIKIIRESSTPDLAKDGLIAAFDLSEIQAKAILELRLRTLTGLEIDKIKSEYEELMKTIEYLKSILGDKVLRMEIIKDELLEIKEKYGDDRRTDIEFAGGDVSIEDMIPDSEVVITISHAGYIKRTPLTEYKKQNRGGVGSKGASTRDKDFIEHVYVATNHQYMLFFTEQGRCFWMRVYEIPEGSRQSKGRAIQNLINLPQDDKVLAFINVLNLKDEEYINSHHIVMCTKKGVIKKTSLEAYSRPRVNGINAITIREGDTLLEAKLTNGEQDIMLAVRSGKAIRFPEAKVRTMGRSASGVRAITVDHDNDEVVGMIVVKEGDGFDVMVVSEAGYGKRSSLEDYRITNRGGKGVKTITVTEKTGELVSLKAVTDEDDLMIITKKGTMIRMGVDTLRVMGRATQGVRLINLRSGDEIASIAKVPASEEEEEVLDAEGNVIVATEGEEGATAPEAPTESED